MDNSFQIISGVLIGLLTGGISSFMIWYYIFHVLVPDIKFSEHISKTIDLEGQPVYRIKFENSGRRRAIDLQINIRYRVKGLYHDSEHRWKVTYIPYSKDKREQIPFISPIGKKQKAMRETIPLLLNDATFEQNIFPLSIRNKFADKTLMLEDLFEIGTEQKLQVNVFCFDEFSGTRKLFSSKVYTSKKDIKQGPFERNSLIILQ